jgi:hypothetical protein
MTPGMSITCRIVVVSLGWIVAFADRTAVAADTPTAAAPIDPLLRVDSGGVPAALYRVDPDVWVVTGSVGGRHHESGPTHIEHWTHVCDAPCDVPVQRGGIFRVAGDGVTPSPTFALGKDVSAVHVRPGSSALRGTGLAAAVTGGALAFTGLALMAMPHPTPQPIMLPPDWPATLPPPPPPPAPPDFGAIGMGTIIVGAALFGAGMAMFLSNETSVDTAAGPRG